MRTGPLRVPGRTRQAAVLVGATTAVLAPFLLYVWSHIQLVTTGYAIEATESQIQALEQENRMLRLERSRLSAAPLVEERARKLGLVPLAPDHIVLVSMSGGRRTPALPPLPRVVPSGSPGPVAVGAP